MIVLIKYLLIGILLFLTITRFYKGRAIFKNLSKKEWAKYIGGFSFAWSIAAMIIISGSKLSNTIQIGWLNNILSISIIFIGLASAEFTMRKTLPEKIKEFYS
ncbi:hypothetical protein ACIQXI_10615 [Lysinibacillus sp. NPDC097195]|uniref:hypothetical protein n=1 Tax=Lysinibacillus sp. NPDC097195 TaxID=3364141 RepID=UPI0038256A05